MNFKGHIPCFVVAFMSFSLGFLVSSLLVGNVRSRRVSRTNILEELSCNCSNIPEFTSQALQTKAQQVDEKNQDLRNEAHKLVVEDVVRKLADAEGKHNRAEAEIAALRKAHSLEIYQLQAQLRTDEAQIEQMKKQLLKASGKASVEPTTQHQPVWKRDVPNAPFQNPLPEFEFVSKLTLYGDACHHFATASRPKFCDITDLEQLVLDESSEQVQMAREDCLKRRPGSPCNFYSQQAEDATLFNMFFAGVEKGTYLEFGAVDGILYSNTKFFEENLGWSGVLLEASPTSFEALQNNRGNRNKVYNLAICNDPGIKRFRGMDAEGGIDDFLPAKGKARSSNTYSVQCDTMRNVLKRANVSSIDFWSLDVEGGELDVLNSMDWSIPVSVLLIERNVNDAKIERLLVEKGFAYVRQQRGNVLWVNRNFLQVGRYA
jgi:FkbM family methyltransferase